MTREVISARDFQPLVTKDSGSYAVSDPFEITSPGQATSPGHIGTHAAGDDLLGEVGSYEPPMPKKTALGDTPGPNAPDAYTSRLLKYIPAEVVALFLTLDALIRSSSKVPIFIYWAVFVFGIVATYFYLWRVGKVRKQTQLHISAVAFFVWVFAIGGPFTHLNWYDPLYGGLLLPVYTFLVAIVEA